jgi:hypothetical protein
MKLSKGICFHCCESRHKPECEKYWGETWKEYTVRFNRNWSEYGIVQCNRMVMNNTYIKRQGKEELQNILELCPYVLEHTVKARCK